MSDSTIFRARQEAATGPHSTQLLPPQFFSRRRAARVLWTWAFVVVALAATMIGVFIPIWIRGQNSRADNSRLIAEAQPLRELGKKAKALDEQNEQQSKWYGWVESAKPDDSLLQALAVIAEAAKPAETGIEINTLEIQLPLEYPASYKQPPRWAAPELLITAKVKNGISARSWLERLSASDRISEAGSRLAPGSWAGGMVQVNAKPQATRCVP